MTRKSVNAQYWGSFLLRYFWSTVSWILDFRKSPWLKYIHLVMKAQTMSPEMNLVCLLSGPRTKPFQALTWPSLLLGHSQKTSLCGWSPHPATTLKTHPDRLSGGGRERPQWELQDQTESLVHGPAFGVVAEGPLGVPAFSIRVPGLESQLRPWYQLLTLEKAMMFQVVGTLPPMWETQIEFPMPVFILARPWLL